MTKGPVAIVLCALAAAIFLLIERRNPLAILRNRWPWQVVAIAIAIGAIWYVPAAIVGGHKIVRIIFAENFGHFMPAKLGGTGESYRPFYYIAARLLGGAFPMTLLILPAALAFYTGEISAEKRRAVIYQISMSLAVLLFFSIASVKRDDYILPALPGIAILCASVFTLETRGLASKLRDVLVAAVVIGPIFVILYLSLLRAARESSIERLRLLRALQIYRLDEPRLRFFRRLAGRRHRRSIGAEPAVPTQWDRRRHCVRSHRACALPVLDHDDAARLAAERSVKSFAPIVADHVKGDQLCIPAGINYELSYYYGNAVPDLSES